MPGFYAALGAFSAWFLIVGTVCLTAAAAFFRDRGGNKAGGESSQARARPPRHSRALLESGCYLCGREQALRGVWLSYQHGDTQPISLRTFWCAGCLLALEQRNSLESYSERAGNAVRDGGGSHELQGVRSIE